MISEELIRDIEEAGNGYELVAAIVAAFMGGHYGIGSSSITISEITQAQYEQLPDPDTSTNIYLVTDG